MANVSFVLKEPTSKDPSLVYMLFRHRGQKLKFSTGDKIEPKFWNPERQRAKESKLFPEYPEFNTYLDKLESTVKSIFRRMSNDDTIISFEQIRNELKKEVHGVTPIKTLDLFQFAEDLIESSSKRPNTIKNYKQTLVKLNDFRIHSKKPLNFDQINLEFYNDFTKYLQQKGYSLNTIGSLIKNIKVFMNEATDKGLNKNLEFLNKRFRVTEENTDAVYLNENEIKKLYDLDLSARKNLDIARDWLIMGACTGLRFSDLESISSDNFIKNNTQIKIKTKKTGETVVIPVHPFAKHIYEKHLGKLPKMSNQKINQYLKEVCSIAGFNEKVLVGITKGGQSVQETYFKYELISTHTARRSFATNLFLADVPSITIMKITGHKTERAFMKYIRLTQEQNADKLTDHPFFN
jgi:integrase